MHMKGNVKIIKMYGAPLGINIKIFTTLIIKEFIYYLIGEK